MVNYKKRGILVFALFSVLVGTSWHLDAKIKKIPFDYERLVKKAQLSDKRISKRRIRLEKHDLLRSGLRTAAQCSCVALFIYSGYQYLYGEPAQQKADLEKFKAYDQGRRIAALKAMEKRESEKLKKVEPWYTTQWERVPQLFRSAVESIAMSKFTSLIETSAGLSFSLIGYLYDETSLNWCIETRTTLEHILTEMIKNPLKSKRQCERFIASAALLRREVEELLAYMRYSESRFVYDQLRLPSQGHRADMHASMDGMSELLDDVNELRESYGFGIEDSNEIRTEVRGKLLLVFKDMLHLLGSYWRVECAGRKAIGAPKTLASLNQMLAEINFVRSKMAKSL